MSRSMQVMQSRSNGAPRDQRFLRSTLLGSAAVAVLALGMSSAAFANPVNGVANLGTPVISTAGSTETVTLSDSRTIIDWDSFNIDPGDTTKFVFGSKN